MKKLMFAMVAALSFAALAQDNAVPLLGPKGGAHPRAFRDHFAMGGDQEMMAVMNPMVAAKLGVSPELREQIKKLEQENHKKNRELQAKAKAAMDKQTELMKAEKTDEAAVMAAIDELFECRKEMAKLQAKQSLAVKAMLTTDQLAKAKEELKNFREQRRAKLAERAARGPKPQGKECPDAKCEAPVAPESK